MAANYLPLLSNCTSQAQRFSGRDVYKEVCPSKRVHFCLCQPSQFPRNLTRNFRDKKPECKFVALANVSRTFDINQISFHKRHWNIRSDRRTLQRACKNGWPHVAVDWATKGKRRCLSNIDFLRCTSVSASSNTQPSSSGRSDLTEAAVSLDPVTQVPAFSIPEAVSSAVFINGVHRGSISQLQVDSQGINSGVRAEEGPQSPSKQDSKFSGQSVTENKKVVPCFTHVITWFSATLVLLIAIADAPLPRLALQPNVVLLLLAATQWALFVVPTFALCHFSGFNLSTVFRWKRSRKRYIFASVVGGVSLWALRTAIWQHMAASAPLLAVTKSIVGTWSAVQQYPATGAGWFGLLTTAALSPAIAEELLFRGFVLSALKPHLGRVDSILMAGALFGMFHLNLPQFFATTALGATAGALAVTSGSILPPILLHATHNAAAIIYGGASKVAGSELVGVSHIFPPWVIGLSCAGMVGMCLLISPMWKQTSSEYWEGSQST